MRRLLGTAVSRGRRLAIISSVDTASAVVDDVKATTSSETEGRDGGGVACHAGSDGADAAAVAAAVKGLRALHVDVMHGEVSRRVRRSRFLDDLFDASVSASLSRPPKPVAVASDTPDAPVVGAVSTPLALPYTGGLLELSFSSLADYQWCPHRFFLRKVVRIPLSPSPAMTYGSGAWSAVHA
jgi:hypothetical protein